MAKTKGPDDEPGFIDQDDSREHFSIRSAIFRDTSISLEARVAIGYLLGLPAGWEIWVKNIQALGMGRDRARRALKELETTGYIRRVRWHDHTTHRWVWKWSISGKPGTYSSPPPEKPSTVEPAEFQETETDQPPEIQGIANTCYQPPEIQGIYPSNQANKLTKLTSYQEEEEVNKLTSSKANEVSLSSVTTELVAPATPETTAPPSLPKQEPLQLSLPRVLSPQQLMVGALCTVTGQDSKLNGKRFARLASELNKAGYTSRQVLELFGADGPWYTGHWKGKRGERPNETDIRGEIKQLSELVANGHGPSLTQLQSSLCDKISAVGRYGDPQLAGEELRVVEALGGWYNVCSVDSRYLRQRIESVYRRS